MSISKKSLRLILIIFIQYMLLIFWIIALKCNMRVPIFESRYTFSKMELIDRFRFFLSTPSFFTGFADLFVNILLFIPIGVLLPTFLVKRKYSLSILISFLLSCFYEVLQIVNCIGGFAYIDLITNTLGGAIGVLIYYLVRDRFKDKPFVIAVHQKKKAFEITSYIVIGLLAAVLIFAFVNTLINIDVYFETYN